MHKALWGAGLGVLAAGLMIFSFHLGFNSDRNTYNAMTISSQNDQSAQLTYYKKPPKTQHKVYQPGKFDQVKLVRSDKQVTAYFYLNHKFVNKTVLAGLK